MPRKMSFSDAMDLVPDDLPDGAFFAMAHEFAGLDYGDGFDELAEEAFEEKAISPRVSQGQSRNPAQAHKPFICQDCKKRFRKLQGAEQHWHEVHANLPVSASMAKRR